MYILHNVFYFNRELNVLKCIKLDIAAILRLCYDRMCLSNVKHNTFMFSKTNHILLLFTLVKINL